MANLITGIRILASAALLLCQPLSPAFYMLYLMAGVSDMIDGPVARKTGTAGDFGAKLDTAADFVLAAACLIKLLPVLDVPAWLYAWIGVIALIKAVNFVSGYVMHKRFAALHTPMNKAAGAVLFLLPLTLSFVELKYASIPACVLATFAAVQEGRCIRRGRGE